MKLYSSPASPFGRKVKIIAKLMGLWSAIEVIPSDTMDASDPLRHHNPLGKIPILILEDGTALYDSRVIVQFLLDHPGGERFLPRSGPARIAMLRAEALADGLQDASLLQVMEGRFREAGTHSAKWLDHQAGKVARALAYLEEHLPSAAIDLGSVATACALGYLDLRFQGQWRKDHPRLVQWLAAFEAQVPAFGETRVTA